MLDAAADAEAPIVAAKLSGAGMLPLASLDLTTALGDATSIARPALRAAFAAAAPAGLPTRLLNALPDFAWAIMSAFFPAGMLDRAFLETVEAPAIEARVRRLASVLD